MDGTDSEDVWKEGARVILQTGCGESWIPAVGSTGQGGGGVGEDPPFCSLGHTLGGERHKRAKSA